MTHPLNGKRVFITGADGFIGSHLVENLVRAGADVKALVYYNSWNSVGWLGDVSKDVLDSIEILNGDVRDAEFIRNAIKGCDYVYHLSSLIAIPYSYDAPRSYVETNIIGALNVLEGVRDDGNVTALVHTSTSEVYGTAQQVPINEDHPLVGQSPYSASKIGADKMAESYYLSFETPVITARPFNTFGPRQTARAVIPTIASQLLAGHDKLTLGALSPTRDFNFVKDTADGIVALSLSPKAFGETVNIGTGEEWSIEETAKLLMKICKTEVPIECDAERIRPPKSEVNRLLADNTKLSDLSGWKPQHTFEQGLSETVDWIRENLHLFNTQRYAK